MFFGYFNQCFLLGITTFLHHHYVCLRVMLPHSMSCPCLRSKTMNVLGAESKTNLSGGFPSPPSVSGNGVKRAQVRK